MKRATYSYTKSWHKISHHTSPKRIQQLLPTFRERNKYNLSLVDQTEHKINCFLRVVNMTFTENSVGGATLGFTEDGCFDVEDRVRLKVPLTRYTSGVYMHLYMESVVKRPTTYRSFYNENNAYVLKRMSFVYILINKTVILFLDHVTSGYL